LLDLEGPVLGVFLDLFVGELSSDESLGIEDGVLGVSGDLVLGRVSNESFFFGESHVRGGGVVSLVVGDDFDFIVDPDSYARVGSSEIDSNGGS
jgi:hypothetical protein